MSTTRRRLLIAALGAGILGPSAAASAAPMVLPGRSGPQPPDWIVGTWPSPGARTLAARHGARPIAATGAFVVARARARALARSLSRRGLLRYAEPDRPLRAPVVTASAAPVPWRPRLGIGSLTPPPTGARAPFLAMLDTPLELAHPAFAAGNVTAPPVPAPYDEHGTATTAIAGGTGVVTGVWPGMRIAGYPFPLGDLTCSRSALLLERASAAGAAAINMSYGSDHPCFTERAALQLAVRRGVVVVASAGNERRFGDPPEFPAGYPHVITVAALGAADVPARFSSSGPAVDLAAPGEGILTAVPVAFDPDGTPDGVAALDGTSFSAPMAAAAAVWLRAARPSLSADQVAAVLCGSARDIGKHGWDARTGCGALDIATALRRRAPRADPLEPNDDVEWVDGTALPPPAPLLWRGGRPVAERASVTAAEDPADVYRVRLPAGACARISLAAPRGAANLRVLDRTALGISDRNALLARSRAPGSVAVANPSRHARIVFVAVVRAPRAESRAITYRLRVSRQRSA